MEQIYHMKRWTNRNLSTTQEYTPYCIVGGLYYDYLYISPQNYSDSETTGGCCGAYDMQHVCKDPTTTQRQQHAAKLFKHKYLYHCDHYQHQKTSHCTCNTEHRHHKTV